MKNKFFTLFFTIIFMFVGCSLNNNLINDNKNIFIEEQQTIKILLSIKSALVTYTQM